MLTSSKISGGINGNIKIPGDKSISHRSIIIPSISIGKSEITNLLLSQDVMHTLDAFKSMGVNITQDNKKVLIEGNGLKSLKKPIKSIYLGNSGTSARLLAGLLSSQNFDSILTGDDSLSNRPMKRITSPLEIMGGKFNSNNGSLPLKIYGQKLNKIRYEISVPSAQVKSGLILAALNTEGKSEIIENNLTRDHTEIMLKSFGANINVENIKQKKHIFIKGNSELKSRNISVPSDLSSASFFIVAALINKNSKIELQNININPTRDGILRVLKKMGGNIKIKNKRVINEEIVADIIVQSSDLEGCTVDAEMAKLMIDEYPILSIASSFAKSPSCFKGLGELKVKESDRLELIRLNLEKCGIYCKIDNEDIFIDPNKKTQVRDVNIRTDFDHRIAMSFAIMGGLLSSDLNINDSDSINTSFPNFIKCYNKAGGNIC